MLINILAAASNAAPAASFGIGPAIKQGGAITIFILVVLALMSVGSFYILIVKWLEQNRIFRQYRNARTNFWRANTLAEGATKLDKNSAWRQLVDEALAAEAQHTKMTDSLEAHDWLHGSLARSEASINAKLASGAVRRPARHRHRHLSRDDRHRRRRLGLDRQGRRPGR